ncbi:uncharacterized protein LOC126668240 [Mercurialis annua]|uniref:uncharacterized protein LOC126668240 n=1 Tax=Mercurialis annua TaxID=3986 RepID=UPI00215DE1AB|nr:uncharacterized protein LOC126668240 [Mercurialis annua]
MFQSSQPTREAIEEVTNCVEQKVTDIMNGSLGVLFFSRDVIEPLKEMAVTKAPGSECFPSLFYKKYWDMVGNDITKVCLKFLNTGDDLSCVNSTVIALIPKLKFARNRMRKILNLVIDHAQNAFVPGRLITDCALIGLECVHVMKKSIKKVNGPCALKLDISKAYDRVEWSFVEAMMLKLGLGRVGFERL